MINNLIFNKPPTLWIQLHALWAARTDDGRDGGDRDAAESGDHSECLECERDQQQLHQHQQLSPLVLFCIVCIVEHHNQPLLHFYSNTFCTTHSTRTTRTAAPAGCGRAHRFCRRPLQEALRRNVGVPWRAAGMFCGFVAHVGFVFSNLDIFMHNDFLI